jgi:hypothetical protein
MEHELPAVITEVAQQAVTETTKSWRAKGEPMEYLTDLVTRVPEGTSPDKVDELRVPEGTSPDKVDELRGGSACR